MEIQETEFRIAQTGHLAHRGVYEIGQDDELAIALLNVRDAAAVHEHEVARAERDRQRLVHVQALHRDIHAALRKAQKATGTVDPGSGAAERHW